LYSYSKTFQQTRRDSRFKALRRLPEVSWKVYAQVRPAEGVLFLIKRGIQTGFLQYTR
jgi:hypothetical protein